MFVQVRQGKILSKPGQTGERVVDQIKFDARVEANCSRVKDRGEKREVRNITVMHAALSNGRREMHPVRVAPSRPDHPVSPLPNLDRLGKIGEYCGDGRRAPRILVAGTERQFDVIDRSKLRLQRRDHGVGNRRNRTDSRRDKQAFPLRRFVKRSNPGNEMAGVGEIEIVRAAIQAHLRDTIILSLKWAGGMDHKVRTSYCLAERFVAVEIGAAKLCPDRLGELHSCLRIPADNANHCAFNLRQCPRYPTTENAVPSENGDALQVSFPALSRRSISAWR